MKSLAKLFVVISIFLLASCASFRGGKLGDIDGKWPPKTEAKKTIVYTIHGKSKNQATGKFMDTPPNVLKAFQVELEAAYNDSGLFSSMHEATGDTGNADLYADVEFKNDGSGSMLLAMISGATFLVVPAYANDVFIVKTTFKDHDGKVLAEVEKKENVFTWFQIIMLPLTPFAFPTVKAKSAQYDICRATLLAAHDNGSL